MLADGEAVVNPEDTEDAFDRLRRGFASRGWIDKEALHYDEQETLTAFQDERLLFMRHWPNAYVTLKAGRSRVGEKVGVAPLPGPGALGGQNLAIAACSNDKATALALIEDLTDAKHQQELFEKGGYPPTRRALYEPARYRNQDLQELARVVKQALDRARSGAFSRPGHRRLRGRPGEGTDHPPGLHGEEAPQPALLGLLLTGRPSFDELTGARSRQARG